LDPVEFGSFAVFYVVISVFSNYDCGLSELFTFGAVIIVRE